ncbi:hypothetical protein Tco_1307923 [Tanacetum coccineum]
MVKDAEWFKEKMLLAQAHEAGVVLHEDQQDFLADMLEEMDDVSANIMIFNLYDLVMFWIPNGIEDIDVLEVSDEVPLGVTKEVADEVLVQQPEPELRKSKRNRTKKNVGPGFQLYLIEGTREEVSDQHSYCFNVEDDSKTFDEARSPRMLFSGNKQLMMRWIPSWVTTLGCWLIYHQVANL